MTDFKKVLIVEISGKPRSIFVSHANNGAPVPSFQVCPITGSFDECAEAVKWIVSRSNAYSKTLEDLDNATAVIDQLSIEKAEHKALIKQLVEALKDAYEQVEEMSGSLWDRGLNRNDVVEEALNAAKDAGF